MQDSAKFDVSPHLVESPAVTPKYKIFTYYR
jgi:hypothetical protein